MYYRNRDTGEVKFGGDVRKLHKKVSFRPDGGTFSDLGYDEIASTPPPAPSTNLKEVKMAAPVQDANGNWVESYEEVDMFSGPTKADDEAAHIARLVAAKEESIRVKRNQKLLNSDWTQVLDAPGYREVWATYRQALRDVPQQTEFPTTVDWPVEPQ
tara:strand:+ start:1019 stop:1489 length:471 start_codon:yes stop_codon:yes gene_type:complete